ncbi:MAG: hypothetical protein AAB949_00640 [Patescibacteria group bacterium]
MFVQEQGDWQQTAVQRGNPRTLRAEQLPYDNNPRTQKAEQSPYNDFCRVELP